jgi:hypothetical protein
MKARGLAASAARIIVAQPLHFGDARQIEALEILLLVEELEALGVEFLHCPRCNGTGYKRCLGCTMLRCANCDDCASSSKRCNRCSGTGTIEIENFSELTARGLRSLLAEAKSDAATNEKEKSLAAKAGGS